MRATRSWYTPTGRACSARRLSRGRARRSRVTANKCWGGNRSWLNLYSPPTRSTCLKPSEFIKIPTLLSPSWSTPRTMAMSSRLMSRATGISSKGKLNLREILLCSGIYTAITLRPWCSDSITTDSFIPIQEAPTSLSTPESGSRMRSPSFDSPLPIASPMSISSLPSSPSPTKESIRSK